MTNNDKFVDVDELGEKLLDLWLNVDIHEGDFIKRRLQDLHSQIHHAVMRDMKLSNEKWIEAQEKSKSGNKYELIESLYYSNMSNLTSQVLMMAAVKQRYWPKAV